MFGCDYSVGCDYMSSLLGVMTWHDDLHLLRVFTYQTCHVSLHIRHVMSLYVSDTSCLTCHLLHLDDMSLNIH